MGNRDAPVGPVTGLGSSGPGYYQTDKQHGAVGGPRLTGRKSGRTAPRDHIMQPAWEDTLQRHDLLPKHDSQVGPNKSFDANQGQLFDPQVVAPRDTRSDVEIARSVGAPTGGIEAASSKQNPIPGATPGFMPGLNTKQKIAAIHNVGEGRAATGASRGGAPFAEIMEDRAKASGRSANWYMGTDSSGRHQRDLPGEANRQISGAAARTGSSYSNMARAVAATSPQMGWKSEGTTDDPMAGQTDRMGSSAGMHPNLAVAEDVVRTATRSVRRGSNVVEDQHARAATPVDDRKAEASRSRFMVEHPAALGGTTDGRVKAAKNREREMRNPGSPMPDYPIQGVTSQKAANFDLSLNLAHSNKAVQRIAATSWTVDRHDAEIAGMNGSGKGPGNNEFQRRGTYEAVAMTGRRAALKNRELPPNEQASQWESRRAQKGLGQGNQMFQAGGTTVPRPELAWNAPLTGKSSSRNIRRGTGGTVVPDDLTPF
jgi:hypothetical protein